MKNRPGFYIYLRLLLCVVYLCINLNAKAVNDSTQNNHHVYLEFNPLTPLIGNLYESHNGFIRPISFISCFRNISFYPEYRYKQIGFRFPIRLPIQKLDTTKIFQNSASANYYSSNKYQRVWRINYEFGIKPIFYLTKPNQNLEMYMAFGYSFGQRRGIKTERTVVYELDMYSNLYTSGPVSEEVVYSIGENQNYYRLSFGTGLQYQFKRGIILGIDVEALYGKFRNSEYLYYSNYNSSDNTFTEVNYDYYRRDYGVQINFNIGYRFF